MTVLYITKSMEKVHSHTLLVSLFCVLLDWFSGIKKESTVTITLLQLTGARLRHEKATKDFLSAVCQVKAAFEHASGELSELKASLAQTQQKEQKSVSLVQELTTMVREQKDRIAELAKSRKEAISELKVWTGKTWME